MLTASRALAASAATARPLPEVPDLKPLYQLGLNARIGDVIMIAGRSGGQKSGFALWWVQNMGLDTLYMSGDMTAPEAASRLAASTTGTPARQVLADFAAGNLAPYTEALNASRVSFAFGQPITWEAIIGNVEAAVEARNAYPEVIVIDNLMDMAGGESDYAAQTAAMQDLTGLARATGATLLILHHASEKGVDVDLSAPPARRTIKNGLSEKPQIVLGVQFVDHPLGPEMRIGILKQRSGKCDPSGQTYARLAAYPEVTRFGPLNIPDMRRD